jgi:hypothetical protein
MYAADVKLFTEVTSDKDIADLQQTLNKICDWSATWKLPISLTKCSLMNINMSNSEEEMIFKLGNSILSKSAEIKDLVILIDQHLTFRIHINYVVRKAYTQCILYTCQSHPALLRLQTPANDTSSVESLFTPIAGRQCLDLVAIFRATYNYDLKSTKKVHEMFARTRYTAL